MDSGTASPPPKGTLPPLTAAAVIVEADQSASALAQALVAGLVLTGLVILGVALRRRHSKPPAPDPT